MILPVSSLMSISTSANPPSVLMGLGRPRGGGSSARRVGGRYCGLSLALLLLAPVLGAQPLPDPSTADMSTVERLDALVERVKLEQNRLRSLEADFTQRKESSWLVEAEESRGVFSYDAPDSVRWEYHTPNPIVVVIRGKELITWYRDLGRAERLEIQRYSDKVFKYLGASGSLETLMQYFTLTAQFPQSPGQPYRIQLVPRYARISKRLKSMVVWFDPQNYIPVRVEYVEPNGDLTEYRFENFRINSEIPRERFELELPPGVELRVVDVDRGR